MNKTTRYITRISVVAALYFVLTAILYPISFGQLQIRVAEALTLLPFIFPEAVIGVTIGCFFANLLSPFGVIDMIFGTSFTFIAALITMWLGKHGKPIFLAPLPPIIINAFGVSFYVVTLTGFTGNSVNNINLFASLKYIFQHFSLIPYLTVALWIGIGEAIATYALGIPLIYAIKRRKTIEI
jgi:uncharacterized membrane protein